MTATSDQREEFWDRLEDCRTGMLEVAKGFVPMTHSLEPEDGNLWFLTAADTAMAEAAAEAAQTRYIVSNDSNGIFTTIEGSLCLSQDRDKLEEVWSFIADAFYDEGKQDPDVRLVKLTPSKAEVWLGPESGFKFLWAMAKAKITGETADYGSHFTLTFPER